MEQLLHFTHSHMLELVHMQPTHNNESSDEEEKDEDEKDFIIEDPHGGKCNMCKEHIYSFHLCYYDCKDCDYSLHKFCAEMPITLQNHPLHPSHTFTLANEYQKFNHGFTSDIEWTCTFCNLKRKNFFNYHCSICKISIDIICASMSQQKMDHPSHHHQLQRKSKKLISSCNACGHEHEGTFYHCTTCSWFWIHEDCAVLPTKLLIQKPTNGTFTHSHPLTLSYSFPYMDQEPKFFPKCRVCNVSFYGPYWLYRCDKCRYYIHISCATSNYVKFLHPGHGKTYKNFKDEDHPNLLHCPFPDESYNLLKHHLFKPKDFLVKENHGEMVDHHSHQHPLILLDTQTSLGDNSVFLHDPIKKIQLLCDGCVKPITTLPFYKCSKEVPYCGFVLHEWCARLPSEVEDHPCHLEHTLLLMPNVPRKVFNDFYCEICKLPSNGFAYGCTICDYYVDINCTFLPEEITHEAHPDHLLSRIDASFTLSKTPCNACNIYLIDCVAFHCPSCNFYLDTECAFLVPRVIRHKYDKHPLSLRYSPVENHPSNYFCEICEDEFDPESWFYHCNFCVQSMHTSCASAILQCEQAVYATYEQCVFHYVNVKFRGTLKIKDHLHCLAFVQGIECHGHCKKCDKSLQHKMIFNCLECEYAVHHKCVSLFGN